MACGWKKKSVVPVVQTVANLVGKSTEDAINIAVQAGLTIRIIAVDNKLYRTGSGCKQKIFSAKRVNLRIKNKKVIGAHIG